jgi:hypothetical protein
VGRADDADLAAGAAPAEVAVIDHNTAALESLATPEQCRDVARETGARKFRVEGTPVGNSRLLCLPTAKRVQTKLGGEIVNYRPRPELPPLERAAKEAGLPPLPALRRGVGNGLPNGGLARRAATSARRPALADGAGGHAVIDLRRGDYREVLADVECDLVCSDPPYSKRTHEGHDAGASLANKAEAHWERSDGRRDPCRPRRAIAYDFWTEEDVNEFVEFWAPRNRGWFVCLSDSELCGTWRAAFEDHGLCGFQPVTIFIPGMTVRMADDGPSSWTIYANVARPRREPFSTWGTLPGG